MAITSESAAARSFDGINSIIGNLRVPLLSDHLFGLEFVNKGWRYSRDQLCYCADCFGAAFAEDHLLSYPEIFRILHEAKVDGGFITSA